MKEGKITFWDKVLAVGAFILLLIIVIIDKIIRFPVWLFKYLTGRTKEGFIQYTQWWHD